SWYQVTPDPRCHLMVSKVLEQIEREVVHTAATLVAARGPARRRAVFLRLVDDARITLPIAADPHLGKALAERRAGAAPVEELPLPAADLRRMTSDLATTHLAFAPVFVHDEPYGVVVVTLDDELGFSPEQL